VLYLKLKLEDAIKLLNESNQNVKEAFKIFNNNINTEYYNRSRIEYEDLQIISNNHLKNVTEIQSQLNVVITSIT